MGPIGGQTALAPGTARVRARHLTDPAAGTTGHFPSRAPDTPTHTPRPRTVPAARPARAPLRPALCLTGASARIAQRALRAAVARPNRRVPELHRSPDFRRACGLHWAPGRVRGSHTSIRPRCVVGVRAWRGHQPQKRSSLCCGPTTERPSAGRSAPRTFAPSPRPAAAAVFGTTPAPACRPRPAFPAETASVSTLANAPAPSPRTTRTPGSGTSPARYLETAFRPRNSEPRAAGPRTGRSRTSGPRADGPRTVRRRANKPRTGGPRSPVVGVVTGKRGFAIWPVGGIAAPTTIPLVVTRVAAPRHRSPGGVCQEGESLDVVAGRICDGGRSHV